MYVSSINLLFHVTCQTLLLVCWFVCLSLLLCHPSWYSFLFSEFKFIYTQNCSCFSSFVLSQSIVLLTALWVFCVFFLYIFQRDSIPVSFTPSKKNKQPKNNTINVQLAQFIFMITASTMSEVKCHLAPLQSRDGRWSQYLQSSVTPLCLSAVLQTDLDFCQCFFQIRWV